MDFLQLNPYAPSRLSYGAIREYAWRVEAHHELSEKGQPVDLEKLVILLKAEVTYRPLRSSKPFSSSNLDSTPRLLINLPYDITPRRARFALAHAIAHFYVHALLPQAEGKLVCFGAKSTAENDKRSCLQANVFAAALLLPRNNFMKAFEETQGDAWALSQQFFVSPLMCETMADVLQLSQAPVLAS